MSCQPWPSALSLAACVMDCSVGLPGKGGRFRLMISVNRFLNPRGSEAISEANCFVIRVANCFASRAQLRSLILPKPLPFGSVGETAEMPFVPAGIASRLLEGFGTPCSMDIAIPLAGIDGRVIGFVTRRLRR